MTFHPRTAILDVLSTTTLSDPDDITREVVNRTPDHELREAYTIALRSMVRSTVSQSRALSVMDEREEKAQNESATVVTDTDTDTDTDTFVSRFANALNKTPKKSSKISAIKTHHDEYYSQRVFAQGQWKILGDCTLADVRDLAQQSQVRADQHARRAREWTDLAKKMEESGATTVKEVDNAPEQ